RVADFRTGMTEAGMQNLQDPPTDQELRLYYATCAPTHRSIHQRSYDSAATEYRRLAEASRDSVLRPRYETIACQLDFCGRMKAADSAFPPSAADLHAYFSTLRQRSL